MRILFFVLDKAGKTNILKVTKFQINIHTKGCDFNDFLYLHSKNSVAKIVKELTQSVKDII